MNPPEELRTARLLLRRIHPEDSEAMVEIHTDPETNRYHPGGAATPDQARGHFAEWLGQWSTDGIGYWTVVHAESGEVLGFGGLRHGEQEGEQVLNLYYRFRPSTWGHGYAPEMAAAAVDWAHRARPHRPVVVRTRPENVPAQRVAEKIGFVRYAEYESRGHREWLYRLR